MKKINHDIEEDLDDIIEDIENIDVQEGKKKDESDMDEEDEDEDEDEDDQMDEGKKTDPIGKEDGDIDNDGDEDESDEFLAARRKAIADKKKNESVYKDELDALTESDETLSEDFKEKAAIIFEAALSERVREETERLEEEFATKLDEETDKIKLELAEKVDDYLTYAVESWVEDNKIAIESGLRTEVAENFISSLKDVFVEHYIEVPDTKRDIVSELEAKIVKVEEALCASGNQAKALSEQVETLVREKVLAEASESLADTQRARLQSLTEGVEFVDEESFTKKVSTIKECYFNGKAKEVIEEELEDDSYKTTEIVEETIEDEVDPTMQPYLNALSKIRKANAFSGTN